MPSIVSVKDTESARTLAFTRASKGKTGYYHYMRDMLAQVPVNGSVTLDENDLVKMSKRENIETLPARIAALRDGTEMSKETAKDISAIRSACERELREAVKDEKATLVSHFPVTLDEQGNVASVAYAVKRTR